MKSRKQICQKLEEFYREVRSKRKDQKMKLQVDQELQQVKIKDLNDLNNVEMFSTSLRGGKAFAAEQKVRKLKARIAKLNSQKQKIGPIRIIEILTKNMNIQPSKKYIFSPEEVEKNPLKNERFRTVSNMHRLERTQKLNIRQDSYGKQKYLKKRKMLRDKLNIEERDRVYALAERMKKKSTPAKFYKQSVQNISYFNKDTIFTGRKQKAIDEMTYYCVKNTSNNKNLTKQFLRSELFALHSNFL